MSDLGGQDQLEGSTSRSGRAWVRAAYLYLLSVVGVVLIAIGGIRLLDLGLKAFIFQQADEDERLGYMQPPMPYALERVERLGTADTMAFRPEEREAIRQWLAEYRRWETQRSRVDPIVARRQRTASNSLAMILVGLPLYLYHWGLIRRESRARIARRR